MTRAYTIYRRVTDIKDNHTHETVFTNLNKALQKTQLSLYREIFGTTLEEYPSEYTSKFVGELNKLAPKVVNDRVDIKKLFDASSKQNILKRVEYDMKRMFRSLLYEEYLANGGDEVGAISNMSMDPGCDFNEGWHEPQTKDSFEYRFYFKVKEAIQTMKEVIYNLENDLCLNKDNIKSSYLWFLLQAMDDTSDSEGE